MGFIDSKRIEGKDEFVILMSSPGGTVHAGLTIYNYLKALPSKVTTCNFGSVDSIGIVMYCGGSTRLSVPQARFLIHGPKISVNGPIVFDEKELDETLKGLRIDSDNIAKVMAANTNRSFGDVKNAMFERTTLTPEQAKLWGLVHEIKSELYDSTDYVYHVDTKP